MDMNSHTNISDAAKVWLKRCRLEGLERATLRSYEGHVRHHIEPRIGDLLLNDLTTATVRDFLDEMLETSSRAMTTKVLASLRSIISEAQTRNLVEHNVAREVRMRRQRRHEIERVFPTKQEIRSLIQNVSDRHRPIVVTAIFTGMRASELRGLTWENVDFERRVIRVRQKADRYNEIGQTKSRTSRRDIPMAPMVTSVLEAWSIKCPAGSLGLVFPNGVGNIESHANIYHRIFKPLMIENEITDVNGRPRFGIHGLRHAAASLFIDQGWQPKKIQSILGHSTINMTFDVYGHLFEDTDEDLALMDKLQSDLLAA